MASAAFARRPEAVWAVEIVQVSAILGLAAHMYIWWRAYKLAIAPSPEAWLAPGLLSIPFLIGLPVLYGAYRRVPSACMVLLGATFVGLVGAVVWLAGAVTGDDVFSVSNLPNALDRTVFLLVPSLVALPLAAACARLGMLSGSRSATTSARSKGVPQ